MDRATVTITADLGPDRTVTAMVVPDVSELKFNFDKGIIALEHGILRSEFAYTGITTVSFTISGQTTSVTIS